MRKTTSKYSPEVRERAVRLVLDSEGQHASRWQAVLSIAAKIGCTPQTLYDWVKKAEVNSGRRAGVPTEMAEKMKALERENRDPPHTSAVCTSAMSMWIEPLCATGSRTMARADRVGLELPLRGLFALHLGQAADIVTL